jgi:hypothetical protein
MRWIFFFLTLGCAAAASAQTEGNPLSRGTTLELFAGAAAASPVETGTFGTALGWELTHRFEVTGAATWLWQRHGSEAFAADMRLLVNLMPASTTVVPFIAGGGGLYRAVFDGPDRALPDFYAQRAPTAQPGRVSYTDPTALLSGGAHVHLARHLSLKPEVTVRFVADDARAYRVTTITCAVVYHLGSQPSGTRRTR